MDWDPDEMDRLERAITEGARIQIFRRGTEYVLVPQSLHPEGATEILLATTTLGGDDLRFRLDEIEEFQVIL